MRGYPARGIPKTMRSELVPEQLIVDVVVELDFGCFDDSAKEFRAAVRRCLLQIGVASFYILAQQCRRPLGVAEEFQR